MFYRGASLRQLIIFTNCKSRFSSASFELMPFLFYKREQHREAWLNLACLQIIYTLVSIQMQECKCQKCPACPSSSRILCLFTLADSMQNQGQNLKLSFVVETIIRLDGAYHKYYIIKTPFCWNTSNHQ